MKRLVIQTRDGTDTIYYALYILVGNDDNPALQFDEWPFDDESPEYRYLMNDENFPGVPHWDNYDIHSKTGDQFMNNRSKRLVEAFKSFGYTVEIPVVAGMIQGWGLC